MWRLDLRYEGTRFKGWARQPGERTVEGVLDEALATVVGERVKLSVAGRTDAGVHADGQVASFVTSRAVVPGRLRQSLNALLPPDVGVTDVSPAPRGFVARAARSRTYRYRVWCSPFKPVHERAYVWDVRGRLDPALLVQASALLLGHHDFAALTPSARDYHSCVRNVVAAAWHPALDGEWAFEVTATSFLHNMVRVAVGSMVDVARGKRSVAEFGAALASGERRRMGQTAPARGLTLLSVEY